MRIKNCKIVFLFILVLVFSCKKEKVEDNTDVSNTDVIEKFIHLSHTRKSMLDTTPYTTYANPNMDDIIEKIDYSKYSMLLLGGDLTQATSADDETMQHVDSIFNLGNITTLWSLGNHDYSDLNRIHNYTHRPAYYVFNRNKITFIVLDTQDSTFNILANQKAMFDNVIDTIENSSHLIVLHHVLLWMYGNPDLEPLIDSISNIEWGDCSYCFKENNFYADIYSRLLEVKHKGINVICIGGDIGLKINKFEYTTADDIHFLSSGVRSDSIGSQVLIFNHNIKTQELTWKFDSLASFNQ
jgi:3',5'-cyclic AMP phosphodiesterase CpdA